MKKKKGKTCYVLGNILYHTYTTYTLYFTRDVKTWFGHRSEFKRERKRNRHFSESV